MSIIMDYRIVIVTPFSHRNHSDITCICLHASSLSQAHSPLFKLESRLELGMGFGTVLVRAVQFAQCCRSVRLSLVFVALTHYRALNKS
jgi:hypothetical protein